VSAIDLAHATRLAERLAYVISRGGAAGDVIREALAAVALEAGDAVQAAHRGTATVGCEPCAGTGYAHPMSGGHCAHCGGTGVADAAVVLGLERPR
jgi:DnaJ-class molecular chaperone